PLTPPHSPSPLLPYTTLFRSVYCPPGNRKFYKSLSPYFTVFRGIPSQPIHICYHGLHLARILRKGFSIHTAFHTAVYAFVYCSKDRKSTRLNSSHVKNS